MTGQFNEQVDSGRLEQNLPYNKEIYNKDYGQSMS